MNITLFLAQAKGIVDTSGLPQTKADDNTINTIFYIVFAIIGSLALLVVVLAGARYIFSKGEPEGIQKAKNELKYALIGLLIVSLAAAIVNFVLDKL